MASRLVFANVRSPIVVSWEGWAGSSWKVTFVSEE